MLAQGSGGRIAILVRNLGALANPITDELANEDISYFNGLFSDTDPEFIEFNAYTLSRITDAASGEKGVSRSAADKIIDSVSDELLTGSRRFEYGRSYAMLLGALRKHPKTDCVAMGLRAISSLKASSASIDRMLRLRPGDTAILNKLLNCSCS